MPGSSLVPVPSSVGFPRNSGKRHSKLFSWAGVAEVSLTIRKKIEGESTTNEYNNRPLKASYADSRRLTSTHVDCQIRCVLPVSGNLAPKRLTSTHVDPLLHTSEVF